jgi:hypothetical protein
MPDKESKVGDRVVAISHTDDDKMCHIYGCGVYEGDYIMPTVKNGGPVGVIADMARKLGHKNPRIKLDDGNIVWGCECWWGPESVLDKIPKTSIVKANIRNERKPYLEDKNAKQKAKSKNSRIKSKSMAHSSASNRRRG